MSTEVSISPRTRSRSGTRRRILIDQLADIRPELLYVDGDSVGEHGSDGIARNQPMAAEGRQFTDGNAVSGYHE